MSEDFSDVKLPDKMDIDEWFIGDVVTLPNDFEEGPYDPEWDLVGDFASDQLSEYLPEGWRRNGVRITWDEVKGWYHQERDDITVCEIHIFGPKEWIDQYKESAARRQSTLPGPWPVTKLKTKAHDMPFYESKTKTLVELDEAARKKKREPMSPEAWKAYWRKRAEDEGIFHLSIDAVDPDELEKDYRKFIAKRTNPSDIEYGEGHNKVPWFKTTVHGGALECEMSFHTWQDAEKFMIDVYGQGMPAEQWEDEGYEHPDFYMYGEDYGQDLK